MGRKSKAKKKRKIIKEQPRKQIPKWINPTILGLLIIGAFLIKTIPSWSLIFQDELVIFRGVDAWYHMRLIDNMMINFPFPLEWDMLILYPEGMNVGYFPLLSWIVAIPGQIFNYEVVGALLPPILGALTLIPIYFICKTLWKGWIGLIACLLLVLLPSEFFHRTLLGFTDHHILEIFFSTLTILFLILFSKSNKKKWIILAGISLGFYFSSWTGGLLLVAPILIWFLISFFTKFKNREPLDGFCKNLSIMFGLALLIFLPSIFFIQGLVPHLLMLGLITLFPIILLTASKYLEWKSLLKVLIGVLIAFIILLQFLLPQILEVARSVFIAPTSTIQEAQASTPRILMAHYGISFLLCIGGLILAIKKKQNLLLVIWCLFMLILTISQRRWSYYFVINNTILASYFIYLIAGWVHRGVRVAVTFTICVILAAVTLPSTLSIMRIPPLLNDGWYQSCIWLKENTPEIEGYYALESNKSSYGILSWWDFGNWITRIGKRAPCSNPMVQHVDTQWKVFLAQSEKDANSYLEGIEYIVINNEMVTTKLYAIQALAPDDTPINKETFIIKLWNETSTTWGKIYQFGGVKIYGRI